MTNDSSERMTDAAKCPSWSYQSADDLLTTLQQAFSKMEAVEACYAGYESARHSLLVSTAAWERASAEECSARRGREYTGAMPTHPI